ncbi:Spy/CpxP family protein refolding chaperone [Marinobacter xiaoshiensis]|uniref:Spy/CpxP family protein refolding chaperone n=1 Tax=Marinobacter xiaoshiensis TaxID=3073652 RepID=A0ABU2HF45_9GAMM|nr:Spy/CpxP family protein refolding chaperone [Marinobacter sp. F60267]MDS1309251.1 Spy/CpxP family protein refolding chaperone [Marinobacter sp. F60267]
MSKRKSSIIAAGILASALFAASPALMASNSSGNYGDGQRGNQRDMTEMCENMREGKGRFNHAERQAEMAERREAMAERLKLTDEQRVIWNEIHEENRQKNEKRMKKMQDKMKKRCDNPKK